MIVNTTSKFKDGEIISNSKFIVRCIADEKTKNSRVSKGYKSLESLRRHCERCKNFNDRRYDIKDPKREEVISAIKKVQERFGKNAPVNLVPEFHEWGVLIK